MATVKEEMTLPASLLDKYTGTYEIMLQINSGAFFYNMHKTIHSGAIKNMHDYLGGVPGIK